MSDDHALDAQVLNGLVRSASVIRVYDRGASGSPPRDVEPVLTISDRAELDELARLLEISRFTGMSCMCLGDSAFELLDHEGTGIDVLGWHHGSTLRWQGSPEGDVELAHGPELIAWMADHGYTHAAGRADRREQQRRDQAQALKSWTTAAPEAVRAEVPRILAEAASGLSERLVDDLAGSLAEAHPGAPDQALALLRWRSGGTGRYSGYPVHEGVATILLERLPLQAVFTALAGVPATDPAWSGAVRYLLAWRPKDIVLLRRIQESVWSVLAQVVHDEDDSTWADRYESCYRQVQHARAQRERARRRLRDG
ncbi:hypothetical protein ACFQHV_04560 [Promicromonospora thailandica]|uniref:Uncharacterized protein n=1 Tax=Promicromonospora thailandica TaxID=765201 RepID=A0A9X2G5N5_9MICO|nr:hypothetical protein [Promicromonospora thailandica]MCP2265797.1 hypothetical protein [Promicromonospora thailandica]